MVGRKFDSYETVLGSLTNEMLGGTLRPSIPANINVTSFRNRKSDCLSTRLEMPINFENPPINEVIVATYFDPPLDELRSEHIGLFWQEIRDQFPVVQQQLPTGNAQVTLVSGPNLEGGEIFPLPRYWFVAEDEVTLLQVQKDAFMLNWRSRDKEYPGFAAGIKPAFDRYFGVYSDFIKAEISSLEPSIGSCELTYVNTIQQSEYWSGLQETKRVIPSFSVLDPRLPGADQNGFHCNYVYSVTEDIRLQIGLRNGFLTQQPEVPVLIFEIKTTGRPDPASKSRADAWFERAHKIITDCFLGLTNDEIQTGFWQRTETRHAF